MSKVKDVSPFTTWSQKSHNINSPYSVVKVVTNPPTFKVRECILISQCEEYVRILQPFFKTHQRGLAVLLSLVSPVFMLITDTQGILLEGLMK